MDIGDAETRKWLGRLAVAASTVGRVARTDLSGYNFRFSPAQMTLGERNCERTIIVDVPDFG